MEIRNDAASDDVVLHWPDDDGLRISAMISFLYIAFIEALRLFGTLVTVTLLSVVMMIHWPIQAADWMLDKVKKTIAALHVWLEG